MDAIIVGGGIVGGAIAWRLAQAGAAVTLLDAGVLGGEASWAGAGMLAPGGEFAGRNRCGRSLRSKAWRCIRHSSRNWRARQV
jgi:glycine/D-amino acid oxidase-like deaminating enzyme